MGLRAHVGVHVFEVLRRIPASDLQVHPARATIDLVAALGAEIVACALLVELTFLGGRARLGDTPVHAVLSYDD